MMIKKEDWATWTVLAVIPMSLLVGFLWTFIAPEGCETNIVVSAISHDTASTCTEFWLNRYQSILAGALALAGAGGTVWAILRQIRASEELQLDKRKREHLAAQSVLALALSSLTDYCADCVSYLLKLQQGLMPDMLDISAPNLPDDLVDPFMQCIRYTSEDRANQIGNLLTVLQIQHARLKKSKDAIAI